MNVSALWSVRFIRDICYKGFLRNSSRTKIFVRLREVSALEDVRLREVPLYIKNKKHWIHLPEDFILFILLNGCFITEDTA